MSCVVRSNRGRSGERHPGLPELRVHPRLPQRRCRRRAVPPPLLRAPPAPRPRRARAAQRRAERAAGGPTRGGCTHLGQPHQHGTRVAYVKDRCRCPACTAANTAAWRAAVRGQIFGAASPYVDAGEVREHIRVLRRRGVGVAQIAKIVHTSATHIREIDQSTSRSGNRPTHSARPPTRRDHVRSSVSLAGSIWARSNAGYRAPNPAFRYPATDLPRAASGRISSSLPASRSRSTSRS